MSDASLNPNMAKWANIIWSPWGLAAGMLAVVTIVDPANLWPVTQSSAQALFGTIPFIIFAVALVAYLRAAGAETLIAKVFQGREAQSIFLATLFGGLAPFCSCEVIPFVAALLAIGAPLSAVMAFWLSSPLIDPPTLVITASALGWEYAIAKTLAALGLGLLGGFTVFALTRTGALADVLKPQEVKGCGCGPAIPQGAPVWKFWNNENRRNLFVAEAQSNAIFLLKWLTLAYVIEGLMIHYVPAAWIASTLGGEGLGPIVLGAVIGMPAYLNSYVAAPLLAGLLEQGMQPGAVLAFMTAGAVSSIPAMAAVYSLVKPNVFALYLSVGVIGAILSGVLFGAIV